MDIPGFFRRHGVAIVVVLGLALLLGALFGCTPPKAEAAPSSVVDMMAGGLLEADSITVAVTFKPGPDDGRGGLDGFLVYAGDDTGAIGPDSVTVGNSVRDHVFTFRGVSPGGYSGYVCVIAVRRQLNSSPACKPWTATVDDVPPPPPVIDSVRVVAMHILSPVSPALGTVGELAVHTALDLCIVAEFAGPQYALRSADAECAARFGALVPVIQRDVTAGQQAAADALCVTWSETSPTGFVRLTEDGGCDTVAVPA